MFRATPSTRPPRPRPVLATVVLLAVLAGCGGDRSGGPTADSPVTDGSRGAEEVTVTLLTHDSFDLTRDLLESFRDETGITIEVVPLGDAGTALNQVILNRDAPLGDLLFGIDTTFLSRALDAGLFVPYRSPALDTVPARFQLDPTHHVTPVDHGDVCLNADLAWFADRGLAVPDDLAQLTEPAYAGLLAVQNPATSSPGLAFLLATIERFGEEGYLEFWADLRANDVLVTDGWSEAYYDEFSAAGVGDRPLVVSYASSPAAEVHFAEVPLESAPTTAIEASCFRQVEFVGILAGTPHEEAARRVVDLLLSRPVQEDIPLTMFVFPVNDQASLPDVFERHALIPVAPFELDPRTIGANREAWIEAWTRTVLR
jgi:thiamine transport system substrate-binding protein